MTVLGHDPVIMLEAPIPATPIALRKAGMQVADIGLFEVNEAFASVPLAWLLASGADPERLNRLAAPSLWGIRSELPAPS